jgi:hypothetical protein
MNLPSLPDPSTIDGENFLPLARDYLLSMSNHTVPARRLALADAVNTLGHVLRTGSARERGLAAVGAFGEMMQVLEAVAILSNSFLRGFEGTAFHARATCYDPHIVSDFYATAPDLTEEELLSLINTRALGIPVLDWFSFDPPLPDDIRSLFEKAEKASAETLKQTLAKLALAWLANIGFGHAYKHGGLVADPDSGWLPATKDQAVAVWLRRPAKPTLSWIWAEPEVLVEAIVSTGDAGLTVLEYICATRMTFINELVYSGGGSGFSFREGLKRLPVVLFLDDDTLTRPEIEVLRRNPGVDFLVQQRRPEVLWPIPTQA